MKWLWKRDNQSLSCAKSDLNNELRVLTKLYSSHFNFNPKSLITTTHSTTRRMSSFVAMFQPLIRAAHFRRLSSLLLFSLLSAMNYTMYKRLNRKERALSKHKKQPDSTFPIGTCDIMHSVEELMTETRAHKSLIVLWFMFQPINLHHFYCGAHSSSNRCYWDSYESGNLCIVVTTTARDRQPRLIIHMLKFAKHLDYP